MFATLTDLAVQLHTRRDYYLAIGWSRDDCAIGLFDSTLKLAADTGAVNLERRADGCLIRQSFGCPSKLIEFVMNDFAIEIMMHNRSILDAPGTPEPLDTVEPPDTEDHMAHQEITLDRTGDRPATFRGELVTSFKSSNASSVDKESGARQWFVLDLYRTAGGTHVAHIKYRAGSKIGRELPKDLLYTGKTLTDLFDVVKMLDPIAVFVTGREGFNQKADPADVARWHESTCRYATTEFTDMLHKFSRHVTQHGGAEEII